jgi:cytochrome c553
MVTRALSAFFLAALGCSLALAEPQWNSAYPELTEALRLKGDRARGEDAFVICQGCHRVGALGRADGSYPRLAGQHATVLIKQIADVRSGRRSNLKMLPFADHQAISVQDIADIAAYLATLPVPPDNGQGRGNELGRGERLYVMDCATCHGPRGEGHPQRFYPRLSGQHFRYLSRENILIRDGARKNANPEMVKAISKYSDEDIASVSDYISRLPVDAPR